jgi:hypothetical protein
MIPVRVSRTTSIRLPPPSIIEGALTLTLKNKGHGIFSFKYEKKVYISLRSI